MIEVKRGVWGGWQWYAEVDGRFVGMGTAPSEEMASDVAVATLDAYVRRRTE